MARNCAQVLGEPSGARSGVGPVREGTRLLQAALVVRGRARARTVLPSAAVRCDWACVRVWRSSMFLREWDVNEVELSERVRAPTLTRVMEKKVCEKVSV